MPLQLLRVLERRAEGPGSWALNISHKRNRIHFSRLWLKTAQCKQPSEHSSDKLQTDVWTCVCWDLLEAQLFLAFAKLKGKEKRWCWGRHSLRFYAQDSNVRVNLDGVRGMSRKCALLVWLTEHVLFLHMVLLLREVHRSSGCMGPTGSYQKSCRRMHHMGELLLSNSLLGNCRITLAEVFSLFCRRQATENRLICFKILAVICFALNFVYNFQYFTNRG